MRNAGIFRLVLKEAAGITEKNSWDLAVAAEGNCLFTANGADLVVGMSVSGRGSASVPLGLRWPSLGREVRRAVSHIICL